MKGLFCAQCFDIRGLLSPDLTPVTCQCMNVTAWWLDGKRGVARYTAKVPAYAWGLGWNNQFLVGLHDRYGEMLSDPECRELHDKATDAPGYFFDKSRFGCWAIPFKPGMVRDVEWATNEERAAVGLEPYHRLHALAPKEPDALP